MTLSEAIVEAKIFAKALLSIFSKSDSIKFVFDSRDLFAVLSTQQKSYDNFIGANTTVTKQQFEQQNISSFLQNPRKMSLD